MNVDSSRLYQQELTEEFLREMAGLEAEHEIRGRLEEVAARFEDSYNAVAWVEPNRRGHGWSIKIIRGKRCSDDRIKHGLQYIMYLLDGGTNYD